LQVKAIAQAHVKTDKIDAGTLASLHAAGLPGWMMARPIFGEHLAQFSEHG
jgi:hypothetical protein